MYYTIQPPLLITMHILVYCELHCGLCIVPKCIKNSTNEKERCLAEVGGRLCVSRWNDASEWGGRLPGKHLLAAFNPNQWH